MPLGMFKKTVGERNERKFTASTQELPFSSACPHLATTGFTSAVTTYPVRESASISHFQRGGGSRWDVVK